MIEVSPGAPMTIVFPSREAEYVLLPRSHRATETGGVAPVRSTSHRSLPRLRLASTYANSRGIEATAVVCTLLEGVRGGVGG